MRPCDDGAMRAAPPVLLPWIEAAQELRAALRYDGLLWRRLAYLGAARGPWWWRRYTPRAFGAILCSLLHEQRRIVADNWRIMRVADGALEAQRGALQTFVAFAECLTDGLESIGRGLDGYSVDSPNDDRFVDAATRGRGALLLTAHTGSWEVIGRLIGKKHGIAVTMVMTAEQNASTRGFAEALRREGDADFEVVYVGADPLAALPLMSALRRGRVVALQFDRAPGGMASLAVPFFGRMQRFAAGPFRLAQVTGAPVIAAFTRRTGYRSYAIDIPEVIGVERARGPRGDELVRDAIARTARELERFVRANPAQWFHFEELSSTLATPSEIAARDASLRGAPA